MKTFQPSAAFQAFFNAVIAAAEAPVTPGSFNPTIPALVDPHEQAFVTQQLLPLINSINVMKASVTPQTAPTVVSSTDWSAGGMSAP